MGIGIKLSNKYKKIVFEIVMALFLRKNIIVAKDIKMILDFGKLWKKVA